MTLLPTVEESADGISPSEGWREPGAANSDRRESVGRDLEVFAMEEGSKKMQLQEQARKDIESFENRRQEALAKRRAERKSGGDSGAVSRKLADSTAAAGNPWVTICGLVDMSAKVGSEVGTGSRKTMLEATARMRELMVSLAQGPLGGTTTAAAPSSNPQSASA